MKREIEAKLMQMLDPQSPNRVIVIEGARQVGKSYLVNRVLQSQTLPVLAFDLEKKKRLRNQIDQTEEFADFQNLMFDQYGLKRPSILFFDEAQESLKLASYIRSFKEDWPDIRVILTGSSMNRFFMQTERMPVGRTQSLTVFPFNFTEFVRCVNGEELADFIYSAPEKITASRHRLLLELFDQYLQVGGYPEAVLAHKNHQSVVPLLDEILAGLEEDFRRKETFQPELFRNILQSIANHIGSLSKLTQFETTKYSATKIIAAMKGWHLILEVNQLALNPLHAKFLPKRYLHDVGIVNRLRSLAIPPISILDTIDPFLRIPLGGLFENALLINLLAGESAHFQVAAWKMGRNSDIEIDFLMDFPEYAAKIPIECKAAVSLKNKHYKNLMHYLALTKQKFAVVVSAAPFEIITNAAKQTVLNLPVYLASKENIKNYYQKNLK